MAILVDTSIWIAHFRDHVELLSMLLEQGRVVTHPYIIGELALGGLQNRASIIGHLQNLPSAPLASHPEAMEMIARHRLAASGIGHVDVHLLASAAIGGDRIWTADRKLQRSANMLQLGFDDPQQL